MNTDNFKWTDKLVEDFTRKYESEMLRWSSEVMREEINSFKQSHTQASVEEKPWQNEYGYKLLKEWVNGNGNVNWKSDMGVILAYFGVACYANVTILPYDFELTIKPMCILDNIGEGTGMTVYKKFPRNNELKPQPDMKERIEETFLQTVVRLKEEECKNQNFELASNWRQLERLMTGLPPIGYTFTKELNLYTQQQVDELLKHEYARGQVDGGRQKPKQDLYDYNSSTTGYYKDKYEKLSAQVDELCEKAFKDGVEFQADFRYIPQYEEYKIEKAKLGIK